MAPLAQYTDHLAKNSDKKTELFDEDGTSLGVFDWVICTVPNGQAVELMADSGFSEQAKITEPKRQACYTLMLGWNEGQSLTAAKQALNWDKDSMPNQIDCHRWRYAATINNKDSQKRHLGVLFDERYQWIVSGDWCGQGNIESCYQMAQQTVAVLNKAN